MKKKTLKIIMIVLLLSLSVLSLGQVSAEENNTNAIVITFEDMINGNFEKLLLSNADPSFSSNVTYEFEDGTRIYFDAYYVPLVGEIFTPNGTDVYISIDAEVYEITCTIPDLVKIDINRRIDEYYGDLDHFIINGFSTHNYNCHSYAWYSQDAGNNVWINNPVAYINDHSYDEIDPAQDQLRVGDIVCYYSEDDNKHSGIITGFTGNTPDPSVHNLNTIVVKSKWNFGPLCEHRGDHTPFTQQTTSVKYYRPHIHSYDEYELINSTCSAPTCSCGKQSTANITHSYTYGYEMIDNTYHAATCACGFKSSTHTSHVADASYVDPIDSDKYAKCKFCGARFIKSTGNFPIIKNKYFENMIDTE